MAARFDTITFLSDYGTGDEFVGVVHSVIRSIAPARHASIDLTHDIPAYDVRAGSLTLGRAAQYLCPGVVLAVVDPGVGTERRGVAVEVGDGQSYLVGPGQRPARLGRGHERRGHRGRRAHQPRLPARRPRARPSPAATSSPRPPPTSATACRSPSSGPPSTRCRCCPGLLPLPREEDGALVAEVLWVDRFGNCQLNVDPDEVDRLRRPRAAALGRRRAHRRAGRHLRGHRGRPDRPRRRQLRHAVGLPRASARPPTSSRMPVGTEVTLRRPRRRRPAGPSPSQSVTLTPRSTS